MKLDRKIFRMVELRVQEHFARQNPAAINPLGRFPSADPMAALRLDFSLLSPSGKRAANAAP